MTRRFNAVLDALLTGTALINHLPTRGLSGFKIDTHWPLKKPPTQYLDASPLSWLPGHTRLPPLQALWKAATLWGPKRQNIPPREVPHFRQDSRVNPVLSIVVYFATSAAQSRIHKTLLTGCRQLNLPKEFIKMCRWTPWPSHTPLNADCQLAFPWHRETNEVGYKYCTISSTQQWHISQTLNCATVRQAETQLRTFILWNVEYDSRKPQ